MNHEQLLIKSFVIKERQERYLNLIATSKGRKKFRNYISHFKDLNKKNCVEVNNTQSYFQLYDSLKSKKAPDLCYVISEHSKYDMRTIPLLDALQQLYNSGIAYFLSCIPGKLAFYQGEDNNQNILLTP